MISPARRPARFARRIVQGGDDHHVPGPDLDLSADSLELVLLKVPECLDHLGVQETAVPRVTQSVHHPAYGAIAHGLRLDHGAIHVDILDDLPCLRDQAKIGTRLERSESLCRHAIQCDAGDKTQHQNEHQQKDRRFHFPEDTGCSHSSVPPTDKYAPVYCAPLESSGAGLRVLVGARIPRGILVASSVLAALKLAFSLGVFLYGHYSLRLDMRSLQTLTFATLILSSQAGVYLLRERGHFWQSRPGRYLVGSSVLGLGVTVLLALGGILMPAVGVSVLLGVAAAGAVCFAALDWVKVWLFARLALR